MGAMRLSVSAILSIAGMAILFMSDRLAILGMVLFLGGLALLGRKRTRRTFAEEARDLILPVVVALAGVMAWYGKTGCLPGSRAMIILPILLWSSMMIGRIREWRTQQRSAQTQTDWRLSWRSWPGAMAASCAAMVVAVAVLARL